MNNPITSRIQAQQAGQQDTRKAVLLQAKIHDLRNVQSNVSASERERIQREILNVQKQLDQIR